MPRPQINTKKTAVFTSRIATAGRATASSHQTRASCLTVTGRDKNTRVPPRCKSIAKWIDPRKMPNGKNVVYLPCWCAMHSLTSIPAFTGRPRAHTHHHRRI